MRYPNKKKGRRANKMVHERGARLRGVETEKAVGGGELVLLLGLSSKEEQISRICLKGISFAQDDRALARRGRSMESFI